MQSAIRTGEYESDKVTSSSIAIERKGSSGDRNCQVEDAACGGSARPIISWKGTDPQLQGREFILTAVIAVVDDNLLNRGWDRKSDGQPGAQGLKRVAHAIEVVVDAVFRDVVVMGRAQVGVETRESK